MTEDERLALIWPKVERAKKHILDLERAITAFHKTNPYAVSTKRNPQTRQLIYYISRVDPIPLNLAAISGDVIHNLRTALDYLHQHLLMVGTHTAAPSKGKDAAFYIDGHFDPNHYKTSAPAKVKGLRRDAIDILNRIEPYKGGKGHNLWIINELNNIDKHRALVMVGAAYRSVSMWPVAERLFATMGVIIPEKDSKAMHKASFIRPADTKCPLKIGDELFIDSADAEPDEKMEFRFDVAINELQVFESQPVVEALQHFTDLVTGVIAGFRKCLA
jgi:hypothetical protein